MHLFDQTHLLTLIFYLTAVRSMGTYLVNILNKDCGISGRFYVSLCQQHECTAQAQGLGHADKSQNFSNHSTTSADETVCRQQPGLRHGCQVHTVSSSMSLLCAALSLLGCVWPCIHLGLLYTTQTRATLGTVISRTLLNPMGRPLIIHIIFHAYPTPLQVWSWINSRISPHTGRKTRSSPNSHLNPHLKSHALGVGAGA